MDRELGYSLHLRATDLIKDFLRESEDHFQYLQEILAEAKEHFERRESVHLLPKTPCTKRKRRRITKEQISSSPPSSPVQLLPCNVSPVTGDTTFDERAGPSTRSRKAKTNQPKISSQPQRKQPRRGAKKVSEVECDPGDEAGINNESKAVSPKHTSRSKRKKSEKDSEECDEKTNKKKKNVVINDECNKAETPKRITRLSKRKESTDNKDTSNQNTKSTPSPKPKKLKVNQPLPKTPQNAEVFIPETPQIQQGVEEPSLTDATQVVRSSLKMVFTPKATAQQLEEKEVCAYVNESTSNNVVVVEAITYENNHGGNVQEKRKSEEQSDCNHSTKKIHQETRSSIKGTKRKHKNSAEQENKARILSPSANSDEGYNTEKNEESNVPCVVATSPEAVTEPTEQPRRSFRPSRGNRRSSRQCAKHSLNNIRKSNRIRQSRSLVKSSVLLTLSAKKLMPTLEKNQTEDNIKEDTIKAKLFGEPEETSPPETVLEQSQENHQPIESQESKNKDNPMPQEELTTEKEDTLDETETHENNSECFDNAVVVDTDQDEVECDRNHSQGDDEDDIASAMLVPAQTDDDGDDDEFQDARESSKDEDDDDDDDNHFHDASDKVDIQNDNARNTSTSSESSDGSTEYQSNCKHHDENDCDQSQSSQENSQENCIQTNDKKDDTDLYNVFGFENKVLKNNAGVIHSFVKRNTPKKVDKQEKTRKMKLAILEKEEKEKERIQKLAELKKKKIEDQKRKREEKERKVAELRAAKTREQREKKVQLEKKQEIRKQLEDKARKVREKEEEARRKARFEKKAECDARRKQEEEQRLQKLKEKEEEEKRHQEMLQRKAEFEEQERQRKILEAKRQLELKEKEQREKEIEKRRVLKEIDEKERKAKEEKEKLERKMREDKEKEEREQKRIAALFKEKEEQERKEREKKAREEHLRKERELRFRLEEEAEMERERLHKLQEERRREEERLKALQHVANNYVMTPPPPPKAPAKSTQDNYNIDDIGSDDSTDDEDSPKKTIPQWAQGAKLKAALMSQSNVSLADIEEIFGGVAMPNLDEIFTQKKRKRFYQRTSSAHWDLPPLKPLNRGTLI